MVTTKGRCFVGIIENLYFIKLSSRFFQVLDLDFELKMSDDVWSSNKNINKGVNFKQNN